MTLPQMFDNVALSDLSLDDLRILRKELTEEEGRVSYWRRLFHARMDMLGQGDVVDTEALHKVLRDATNAPHRWQALGLHPAEIDKSFPEARMLWERIVDVNDPVQREEYAEMLRVVEKSLSESRKVLHARIDEVTAELISRYRSNPSLALTALPRR